MHSWTQARLKRYQSLTYESKPHKVVRVRRIKTRAESSTVPDADREIIQIGSPDALVVSEAYAARAGISFRLSGFRFRSVHSTLRPNPFAFTYK